LGVAAAEAGGEPAPEVRTDPMASVPQKTNAFQDALLTTGFFL
jgi:hypothetical protein